MKKYLKFFVLVLVLFFGATSCQTVKDKTDKIIKKENKELSKYIVTL